MSKAGAANKRPATEETVGRHGASVGDRRLGSRKAAYESRKDSAQSEVMRVALWPDFSAVASSRAVVQREINDEARSDRYRKREHFGCEPRAGDSKCTALSPLSPCANLYLANFYPPKPRPGSPRGRCAHCSVCQSEQSGSHRRWKPWLQSNRPTLVRDRRIDPLATRTGTNWWRCRDVRFVAKGLNRSRGSSLRRGHGFT